MLRPTKIIPGSIRRGCRAMGTAHLAMDDAPAGLPAVGSAGSVGPGPELKVATLPSGLKVASANTDGHAASVGIFVGVGSRNENRYNNGTCNLMEYLAFRDTTNRSYPQLVRDLEACGGNVAAGSSREVQFYSATALKSSASEAMGFLADTVVRPHFRSYIIEEDKVAFQEKLSWSQNDPLATLSDAIHRAAFSPTATLGLSPTCPLRNAPKIGLEQIEEMRAAYYTPSNMLVVGVGMDESALMPLARELETLGSDGTPAATPAAYVGGTATVEGDADAAYVAVGFGNGGSSGGDASAMTALEQLLGGSSSRSDGLGGTVNSRLNQNVAKNDWVQSVAAFNASYSDAGILGAYGMVNLEDAARFRDVVTAEIESIASGGISADEAGRAVAKAKMALATSCDTDAGLVQVVGAKLTTEGSFTSVASQMAALDAVGPAEIQAAAKSLLQTAPSYAVVG